MVVDACTMPFGAAFFVGPPNSLYDHVSSVAQTSTCDFANAIH